MKATGVLPFYLRAQILSWTRWLNSAWSTEPWEHGSRMEVGSWPLCPTSLSMGSSKVSKSTTLIVFLQKFKRNAKKTSFSQFFLDVACKCIICSCRCCWWRNIINLKLKSKSTTTAFFIIGKKYNACASIIFAHFLENTWTQVRVAITFMCVCVFSLAWIGLQFEIWTTEIS